MFKQMQQLSTLFAQQCGKLLRPFAQSLKFDRLQTLHNNSQQQHATGHANGIVGQQCCICLHGAMVITNKLILTSSATLPNLG